MKIISKTLIIAVFAVMGIAFVSCEKEMDTQAPELGVNNVVVSENNFNNILVKVVNVPQLGEMLSFSKKEDVRNLFLSWDKDPKVLDWEDKLSFTSIRSDNNISFEKKESYPYSMTFFLNSKGYIMLNDTVFFDNGNKVYYFNKDMKKLEPYISDKKSSKKVLTRNAPITDDKSVSSSQKFGDYRINGWLEFSTSWIGYDEVVAKTQTIVNETRRYNCRNIGVHYTYDVIIDGSPLVKGEEDHLRAECFNDSYFKETILKARSLKIGYFYTTHYGIGGTDEINIFTYNSIEK